MLGTVSGVIFAYSGDLPQISAIDELRPEHHHACTAPTARSSASSPCSAAS